MGFKRRAVGGLLLAAGVAGYLAWDGHNSTTDRAQAARTHSRTAGAPVTVATVQRADFPVEIQGLGTVVPDNTVVVKTRVDGQIMKIYVREGQLVKAGDLLLKIDPRPYQAALDQAKAKQQQDQASLYNANLNFQRDAQLIKQNFASRQQYDNDANTVRQFQAQLAADQAAVFNAQTQVGYTEIRAPISGRTSIRTVDVGNIVQASSPGIMTIAQVQPIAVNFTAPEGQLQRIYQAERKGPIKVDALSSDLSRTLAEGKLTAINNTVDPATGTIQLKAEFANDDNALWPGLSVATKLLAGKMDNVVVVPEDAVEHGPDGLYAYVIDKDDKAEVRPIQVGDAGSGKVVVTKGLEPGERVAVAGQYRLQQGTRVTVAPQGAPPTNLAQEQQ